ncbi:MAG: hypothetical protein DWQ06_02435 [Calditrichaeota bacterium]|nr:MAG: hypothetical protein DWQ06_02435 [Calditrichota bacterium]
MTMKNENKNSFEDFSSLFLKRNLSKDDKDKIWQNLVKTLNLDEVESNENSEELLVKFSEEKLNSKEKEQLWENICNELRLDEQVEGWEKVSESFIQEELKESDKSQLWENICSELQLDEKVESWNQVSESLSSETLDSESKSEIWNALNEELFTEEKPSNVIEFKPQTFEAKTVEEQPKKNNIWRYASIAVAASFAVFFVANNWDSETGVSPQNSADNGNSMEIQVPESQHEKLKKLSKINAAIILTDSLEEAEKDSLKDDSTNTTKQKPQE